MKTQKLTKYSTFLVLISLSISLCSCALQDPKFLANVGSIKDTDYPKEKIVGSWATMMVSQFQSTSLQEEHKMYFDFRSNGRGSVRHFETNKANGNQISMEGSLKWSYLGKNKWKVYLPASSEYRVSDNKGYQMGSWAAEEETLRYYNGELYMTPTCLILVRPTRDNMSEMAKRQRDRGPLLFIDENAE